MSKPIHQIDKPMRILKHEMACGRLARELTEKIDAVLALESELNELIEQASLTVHDCSSSDVVGFDMFNAKHATTPKAPRLATTYNAMTANNVPRSALYGALTATH